MLNLPRPSSWYFDTVRMIIWCRLTYDKLYILYSDDAKRELMLIWQAAVKKASGDNPFLDTQIILDTAIQDDDKPWRQFCSLIESKIGMPQVIEDYFLGVAYETIVSGIESGVYDV